MAEARLRQDILFPAGASLGISVDEALKVRRVNDPDSRAIKAARYGVVHWTVVEVDGRAGGVRERRADSRQHVQIVSVGRPAARSRAETEGAQVAAPHVHRHRERAGRPRQKASAGAPGRRPPPPSASPTCSRPLASGRRRLLTF